MSTTYEKMDPKVKKEWLVALRSDQYKQGRSKLCDNADHFCCLGVLIDACIDEEWVETTISVWGEEGPPIRTGWGVSANPGTIDPPVMDGALPERLKKKINLDSGAEDRLIHFNDGEHWGFKRIATWIEKNL